MPSIIFDKCCGCIELKTGCFIIGYLNLVLTTIFTIVTALTEIVGVVVANYGSNPNVKLDGLVVSIIAGILLVFLILDLVFCVVLLVGLHKNKPGHLKAYLVYSLIMLVVVIIYFVLECAVINVPTGYIILTLLSILLLAFFLLVIRSMYFQMKDKSRGPAIY